MTSLSSRLAAWTPYAQAALRIVSAYLFLLHGSAKVLHLPYQEHFAQLPLFSLIGLSGVLELFGGLLLLLGLATRPVAFVLCGEMAFAYFMGHAARGNPLLPLLNQGEAAVLYCFIFLFLIFAGPGAFSMDGALTGRGAASRRPRAGSARSAA